MFTAPVDDVRLMLFAVAGRSSRGQHRKARPIHVFRNFSSCQHGSAYTFEVTHPRLPEHLGGFEWCVKKCGLPP